MTTDLNSSGHRALRAPSTLESARQVAQRDLFTAASRVLRYHAARVDALKLLSTGNSIHLDATSTTRIEPRQ